MFFSNRSVNKSSQSARLSNLAQNKFDLIDNNQHQLTQKNKHDSSRQKVEFRKILKSRNMHRRIGENDQLIDKDFKSSRLSKQITIIDKQFSKQTQQEEIKKSRFNQSLKDKVSKTLLCKTNSLKNSQNYTLVERFKQLNSNNKSSQQKQKDIHIKEEQSFQLELKRSRMKSSIYSNQNTSLTSSSKNLVYQTKCNIISKKIQNDNMIEHQKKQSRPKTSSSSFSSITKFKRSQSKISEINSFNNSNLNKQKAQISNKQSKKSNFLTFQDLITQFLFIQSKINNLISDKWKFVQKKLLKEKQCSAMINSKSLLNDYKDKKQSMIRLSKQQQVQQISSSRDNFFHVVSQKNIDVQIMNEIKFLKNLNISQVIDLYQRQLEHKEIKNVLQELQKRRSKIMEMALAECMVEAEFLRKYYSRQNAKGLSSSNYKVGQQNLKDKLILVNNKSIVKDDKILLNLHERQSHPRESISNQSESKSNFIAPSEEDYQKYRYKQTNFKPNVQPFPRSSYNSQFFNYNNIQIFNPKYKEENNMIFPTTSTLKSSSYRNEFRQFSPQRINHKQLDACRNKFKQIDIMYLPKKRSESESESETYTSRKVSKTNKYVNQLDYVKKLKTESMLGSSNQRHLTERSVPKMFQSETRKEFQNPQKLSQQFGKSQIKHKNLHLLKYDLKKKYRV